MLMRDGYAPLSSFGELLKSIEQGRRAPGSSGGEHRRNIRIRYLRRERPQSQSGRGLWIHSTLLRTLCVSLFIHMREFVRCRLTGVGSYRFLQSHVVLRLEFRLRTATGPCIV